MTRSATPSSRSSIPVAGRTRWLPTTRAVCSTSRTSRTHIWRGQLGSTLSSIVRDRRRQHRRSYAPSDLQVNIFSRPLSDSTALLKVATLGVAAWSVLLGSCSQTPVTVNLHALQASEKVSFVCYGADDAPTGHKLDECPDYSGNDTRHVLSLVTQTATNEVAVIDLQAQVIIDDDPATPGYSFLRVGARPGAIVTTPGGAASFVGVSGPTKNGVFAPAHDVHRQAAARPARA